jgi:putative endonuclease
MPEDTGFMMYFVYQLQSVSFPNQRYVGFTSDLKKRFAAHNNGESQHTQKYVPWELDVYHAFRSEKHAKEFESYLKSGSGRAFASKRFWSKPLLEV